MTDKLNIEKEAKTMASMASVMLSIAVITMPRGEGQEASIKHMNDITEKLAEMLRPSLQKIVDQAREEAIYSAGVAAGAMSKLTTE